MTGKYNFDQACNRKNTSCLKYDFGKQRKGRDDLLPMWVADMDFQLPKEILDDLKDRIDHGIFGYTDPDKEYFDALNKWFGERHGYTVKPESVTLAPGIVYGLATCVKAFTKKDDAIIIQQPVYYPFREVIDNNYRKFLNNQLHYEDGKYTIDFDDFEKKIIENNVKMYICCNPHNPVGRVWSKEELTKLANICLKHDVVIVSDEIHCDFVHKGYKFTSYLNLDEKYHNNLAVLHSPGKTFNIAGFQSGNVIIKNKELRNKYRAANSASGYSQGSLMGQVALKSVYNNGAKWVDQLLEYLEGNIEYFRNYFNEHFPKAKFIEPEGTYLTWVDFTDYGFTHEELQDIIINDAKLWLNSGIIFGPETTLFERFNLACQRSLIEEALNRLKEAFEDKLEERNSKS